MLSPQRLASEHKPNSVSLTRKQLRPLRIVVHNQDSAGQWLQLSDCISSDLFLGARCEVIEWLCLFRHSKLISFYKNSPGLALVVRWSCSACQILLLDFLNVE